MSAPLRVPAGARWSCGGCGHCCHHFQLGPVEPEIIAGLEARDLATAFPALADRPFYARRPTADGDLFYLEKGEDGGCVFLQEDQRCGVHARWGAAAKPAFCREFPVAFIEDPRGLAVVAREECGGFHESHRTGAPLEEEAALALALPRTRPIPRFAPEAVAVLPGLGVGLPDWMLVEDELLAGITGADRQPGAHVAALRGRLFGALRRAPPPPEPLRFLQAVGAILMTFRIVLDHAMVDAAGSPADRAYAGELRRAVVTAMARLPDGVPPLAPDARAYINLLLRSHLLGKRFAAHGSVAAGLGLFLSNVATAALAAEQGPDGSVSARALSARYTPHVRLTTNGSVLALLAKARPALVDVFLHAE
jgi:Fe-S-cluster containining protein